MWMSEQRNLILMTFCLLYERDEGFEKVIKCLFWVFMAQLDFPTGLCECFSDINICLYGCFCPFCLTSENWEKVNGYDCNCIDWCLVSVSPYS
jgi:hypothetical protein